jgi:hypothetical protein
MVWEAFTLVRRIVEELGRRNPVFKKIDVNVVGSLKEGTRIFQNDEMDCHLFFEKSLASYNTFDPETQTVRVDPRIGPDFAPYIKPDGALDSSKLFEDFLTGVYDIIPSLAEDRTPDSTMTALTTEYTPCISCMLDAADWGEPQAQRCRHAADCETHDDGDDCAEFTSPCLSHSKMGAVLHMGWRVQDGGMFYFDIDLTCPTIPTSTEYDGSFLDAKEFLMKNKPRGWLEEANKMEAIESAGAVNALLQSTSWGVICRLISRGTVMTQQVSRDGEGRG